MIDYITGKVKHWESEYIVLDVHDIGYRVFTPNPYIFAKNEEAVTVYTHHHVREDAILLFGFPSRDEQKLFRKLLEVSGIGPRVALGILAGGRPESVIAAIQQENIAFLTKLPGIGKKTAQRMILDLKDKLDALPAAGTPGIVLEMDGGLDAGDDQGQEAAWREAREALAALGYTQAELDKAWHGLQSSISAEESVDSLMKRALQWLYKG
ncbi:Holliday junction branch migration protein RuvA [Paenibacillus abyssi]|uniref:Holliday junction branch migration complex subunit RuvA n=1 Tax=Paenibacillus abyssi TaxID=1340531 RepID=A0A917G2Q1_9BACL|nr:Holliday junction branch migration protein RuvA [Paenibacillus abyssi]GGG20163.1 Holliday junction ATP-dependent DNA helicase RuvA [Paenibacillus abyssi]